MPRGSPALAIALQLWFRHRGGFLAVAVTVLAMAVACPPLFAHTQSPAVLVASILPLLGVFGYIMNALLFAEEVGNLSSGYPRRMYPLPVPTRTLVAWPMLYGSAAAAALWLATAGLVYRPSGFRVPLLLPALGLAAAMAWFQALSWSPLGQPWLKVAATGALMPALTGLALWLVAVVEAPFAAIVALLAGYLAAAYTLARAAVACDRRGDTWHLPLGRLRLAAASLATRQEGRRRPFRSPAEAQLWSEWRCHGMLLPAFVAGILLAPLVMGLFVDTMTDQISSLGSLAATSCIPMLVAGSVGLNLARMGPIWDKAGASIAFAATRPMTSGGLVAAKFRMAARSTLLSLALVAAATAALLAVAGDAHTLMGSGRSFLARHPGWEAAAILAAAAVTLPALTWRQLTDSLVPGLTGRPWITTLAGFGFVTKLLGLIGGWLWTQAHPEHLSRSLAALPGLVVAALALKGSLVTWAFRTALRRGLIDGADLRRLLAGWLVLVACAVGLGALLLPPGLPVPRPVALLGLATMVPLARFALAPLALDWDRHR